MMRRWVNVLVITAMLAGADITATAAQAAPIEQPPNVASAGATPKERPSSVAKGSGHGDSEWVSVPVPPFERAAGVVCDFAVKGVPIVADLKKRTLSTYPDGTVRSELWVGPLIYDVTNESTGTHAKLDGSAWGVIVYNTDGSQKWYLHGPLGLAVAAGMGNLPRGLYQVDGPNYTLDISPTRYLKLNIRPGTVENICPRLA